MSAQKNEILLILIIHKIFLKLFFCLDFSNLVAARKPKQKIVQISIISHRQIYKSIMLKSYFYIRSFDSLPKIHFIDLFFKILTKYFVIK